MRRETAARRRDHTGEAAPAPPRPTPAMLALQRAAGNRAVGRIMATGVPLARAAADVDDPAFNAPSRVHDLRRAIDQEDTQLEFLAGGRQQLARAINAELVASALDGLSGPQLGRVQALYREQEGRDLEADLFGTGGSGFPSVLTPGVPWLDEESRTRRTAWSARLRGLLKGTHAAQGAPATAGRIEAVAAELFQLLGGDVDAAARDRIAALHRRPPAELDQVYAAFAVLAKRPLDDVLNDRLPATPHRNRIAQLRVGNWAAADAIAIEEKRRALEGLRQREANPFTADKARAERARLVAGIESIVETNRQEALADPENAGLSADEATKRRLGGIFSIQSGDAGTSLGAALQATLAATSGGKERGAALAALLDGSFVRASAERLREMERTGTTNSARIIALLRGFRSQAEHDVGARGLDPAVAPEERRAVATPAGFAAAVDELAQRYTADFRRTYDELAVAAKGRTWDTIVASADDAYNRDAMTALLTGGGRMSEADELDVAVRKRDRATVVAVLRRQGSAEAVRALIAQYEAKPGRTGLRETLFGRAGEEHAAYLSGRGVSFGPAGLLSGRDAALAAEALSRPERLGGTEEADWLTAGGAAETDVTESRAGAWGRLREIGDDPETQVLMNESAARLVALRRELAIADMVRAVPGLRAAPRPRAEILAEMRQWRATLTGDAAAYEAENARMIAQLKAAVSLAVQVALSLALPGAAIGLVRATALQIAGTVASNAAIYGDEYGWDRLVQDVGGGITGAFGGRFAEEALGIAVKQVAGTAARAASEAAEQAGHSLAGVRRAGQQAAARVEGHIVTRAAGEVGEAYGEMQGEAVVTGEAVTLTGMGQELAMGQAGRLRGRGGPGAPGATPAPDPAVAPPAPAPATPAPARAGGAPASAPSVPAPPAPAPPAPAAPSSAAPSAATTAPDAAPRPRTPGTADGGSGASAATRTGPRTEQPARRDDDADAYRLYMRRVTADRTLEAGLLYNHARREWAVVQGEAGHIPLDEVLAELGWTRADTILARHSHPVGAGGDTALPALLPSGRGGDLDVIRGDASKGADAPVQPQWSAIDVVVGGRPDRTYVFYDRAADRWTLHYPEPWARGGRARVTFGSRAEYHDWFRRRFGFDPGAAGAGPAAPAPAPAVSDALLRGEGLTRPPETDEDLRRADDEVSGAQGVLEAPGAGPEARDDAVRVLAKRAVAEYRAMRLASEPVLDGEALRGCCGQGRDLTAESLVSRSLGSATPVVVARYQVADLGIPETHGFTVVRQEGGAPFLVDPTYAQFPGREDSAHHTTALTTADPAAVEAIDGLLRDGFIPLDEATARRYLRSLGAPPDVAAAAARRLVAGEDAVLVEVVRDGEVRRTLSDTASPEDLEDLRMSGDPESSVLSDLDDALGRLPGGTPQHRLLSDVRRRLREREGLPEEPGPARR